MCNVRTFKTKILLTLMAMVFTGPLFAAAGDKTSDLLDLIAKNKIEVSQDSNCFLTGHGIGCDDEVCESTVCTVDSFCCDTNWDSICVSEAFDMCEITADGSAVATFVLEFNFDDGNDWDTTIAHISCTGGLPLTSESRPIGHGNTITFVLQFPEEGAGDTECDVWVDDVSGYTTSYNAFGSPSDTADDDGCHYSNIDEGDRRFCEADLDPDDSFLRVWKKWNVTGNDSNVIDLGARILVCTDDSDVILGDTFFGGIGKWCRGGEVSGPGDDFFDVTFDGADHFGDSVYVFETNFDSSIEVDISDCVSSPINGPDNNQGGFHGTVRNGESDSCTIENTVFFEGIPVLNQYGLAILALLMLGVGFVGFRRFV